MTDERHDEIAARLRAEAGAQAPERLRTDVMLQVRAAPRPRRIRPRHRQAWRPLSAVAAVACVLAALVFGLSHGGGSAPESALSTSAGASRSGDHAGFVLPGSAPATEKAPAHPGASGVAPRRSTGAFGIPSTATAAGRVLTFQRANLPPRLGRALEALILERGRGAH